VLRAADIYASSLSSSNAAVSEPRVVDKLCAADELRTGDLHGIKLRADVELRVDEPRFAQVARRCCTEKYMLQAYISGVSNACCKCLCGYCKSRSGCCIYYNSYRCMSVCSKNFGYFQTYVARVLFECCICFPIYVASVSSGCCICFTHML
jgi:hypothetical protein